MIKRLKWKMIAAIMVIVTLIVGLVCGFFYHSTTIGIRRASTEMLMRAVDDGPIHIAGGRKDPASEHTPENNMLAYLLIETDETGAVSSTQGESHYGELAPAELAQAALDSAEEVGELEAYDLRFVCRRTPDGWRIAFGDLSFERQFGLHILGTVLLIGCGALLVFFLLSLAFARWATRPIEQAWNRQKQFIADASHEIKTPLTVILSNADLLDGHYSGQDAQLSRWVDNIRTEGGRMRQLVESMLFLARSDALPHAPKIAGRVDWSDAVESSVLTFEPLVFEHGLSIESEIQPDCAVQGDADGLRRLADILLDNAVKYALPGGQIRAALVRESGKFAVLTVSNPSPEISDTQAQNLFQRFYRLDPARTGQNGYGLGLSIAQSITDAAGGRIWMEYRNGTAYFHVRLPLAR